METTIHTHKMVDQNATLTQNGRLIASLWLISGMSMISSFCNGNPIEL